MCGCKGQQNFWKMPGQPLRMVELSDAEESLSQADEIIEVIDTLRKKLIKEL